MTPQELMELNVGQSLDDLMNLDPRGYGVCRILYGAARKRVGSPLSTHAAKQLSARLGAPSADPRLVHIITGFVLPTHGKAETDGLIGSMLLARALVAAFGAKPVVICPEECMEAARGLAGVAGLHLYGSVGDLRKYPCAAAAIPFTKDVAAAGAQADALIAQGLPAAVVSVEAPGANEAGHYHNALGQDVTELEAKSDVLYKKLQSLGVFSLAIGDLGNEIGMGAIAETVARHIPNGETADPRDSIAAATGADCLLTATVSDWGVNALIAALALQKADMSVMHTPDMERDAMVAASRGGAVDMGGWLIPAIDGTGVEMNMAIVSLMRGCAEGALQARGPCKPWFDGVLALGYFGGAAADGR